MSKDSPNFAPEDVRSLKTEIAEAIAGVSANIVPELCQSLGLGPGDHDEAFRSKRLYAKKRLNEKRPADLIEIGHRLLATNTTFGLTEALAKIEGTGKRLITEITRRRIVQLFDELPLTTELTPMVFMERVWPLKEMPSLWPGYDHRSRYDDFFQAVVRNDDWSEREMLEKAGALDCSQSRFFKFLEEVSSPLVQSPDRQKVLVEAINAHLRHDGFRLTVARRLSGSPVYQVQPVSLASPADEVISATLKAFDEDTVHARWALALERRESDPEGAITLARTLLEDVCKWITIEAGESYEEKDELPTLYKRLAKILKLAPDDHTETVFKTILGSCQSVIESLGALRNKISSAHSIGPKRVKPAPRHAELAVNLSGTMATFLVATWNKMKVPGA